LRSAAEKNRARHQYNSSLSWRGTTGAGYETYSREHRVLIPSSGIELTLSADAAFRGDPSELNPEQLLLVAASSCQLLEFLALAARTRIDVLSYEDEASASLDLGARPPRIDLIRLSPTITVAAGADLARVERLVGKAHEGCYIANSLRSPMEIEPLIRHEP
jgi:organic hydroperoxide reductase OsmC/OhrA